MRRSLLICAAATLCLSGSAMAQEVSTQEVIGRVLRQARTSGALERVLGERFFTSPEGGPGALAIARGRLEGEGEQQRLIYTLAMWIPRDQLSPAEFEWVGEIGFDGEMRRITMRRKKGPGQWEEQGLIPSEAFPSWGSDVIPGVFSAFFLAPLHDQGLPPALEGRFLKETKLKLQEEVGRVTQGQGAKGAATHELHLEENKAEPGRGSYCGVTTVAVSGAEEGRITSLWLDGEQKVYRPLTAEVAEELRRRGAQKEPEEEPEGETEDED